MPTPEQLDEVIAVAEAGLECDFRDRGVCLDQPFPGLFDPEIDAVVQRRKSGGLPDFFSVTGNTHSGVPCDFRQPERFFRTRLQFFQRLEKTGVDRIDVRFPFDGFPIGRDEEKLQQQGVCVEAIERMLHGKSEDCFFEAVFRSGPLEREEMHTVPEFARMRIEKGFPGTQPGKLRQFR